MKKAFIKISKKNVTRKEIEELKKLLDETGLKYYVVEDIEK